MARVSVFSSGRCCRKTFIDHRCYENNSSLILQIVSMDVVTAEFWLVFFGSDRKKKVAQIKKSISGIFFLSRATLQFVAVGGQTTKKCGESIFTSTVSALHFTHRCWVGPGFELLKRLHCWQRSFNEAPEKSSLEEIPAQNDKTTHFPRIQKL